MVFSLRRSAATTASVPPVSCAAAVALPSAVDLGGERVRAAAGRDRASRTIGAAERPAVTHLRLAVEGDVDSDTGTSTIRPSRVAPASGVGAGRQRRRGELAGSPAPVQRRAVPSASADDAHVPSAAEGGDVSAVLVRRSGADGRGRAAGPGARHARALRPSSGQTSKRMKSRMPRMLTMMPSRRRDQPAADDQQTRRRGRATARTRGGRRRRGCRQAWDSRCGRRTRSPRPPCELDDQFELPVPRDRLGGQREVAVLDHGLLAFLREHECRNSRTSGSSGLLGALLT